MDENRDVTGYSADHSVTEEQWKAIVGNDAGYDDKFLYAVKTTRIFCRPSCKSRPPNRLNVRVFKNAEQALAAHFRPCKRCKPTGMTVPDREWIDQIVQYIDRHYTRPLSLEHLAEVCHGSPYHLQRTFKRVKNVSPNEYIQTLRIGHAEHELRFSNQSVSEVALKVGIPNVPYFVTLFKRITGYTPLQYREQCQHSFKMEAMNNETDKNGRRA